MNKNDSTLFHKIKKLWFTSFCMLLLFSCTNQRYGYLHKIQVYSENKIELTNKSVKTKSPQQVNKTNDKNENFIASADTKKVIEIIVEQSYPNKIKTFEEYSSGEKKLYSPSNKKVDTPIPQKSEMHKPAFVAFVFVMISLLVLIINVLLFTSSIYLPSFIYPIFIGITLLSIFLTIAAVIMGIITLYETIKFKKRGKGFAIGAILLGILIFLAWMAFITGLSAV